MDIYTPPAGYIVHDSFVDFAKRPLADPIHIVQYDHTLQVLCVELHVNGRLYTIQNGSLISIRFGKPDSTFVIKSALGCDSTYTKVYFDIDEQMTTFEGVYAPVIEVSFDGTRGASGYLPVVIDRNPVQDSDVESHAEYYEDVLRELIEEAERILDNLDHIVMEAPTEDDVAIIDCGSSTVLVKNPTT